MIEGSEYAVGVNLAADLTAADISVGRIDIGGNISSFDWQNPVVNVPVLTGEPSVADGEEITLQTSAQIQVDIVGVPTLIDLKVANSISLRVLLAGQDFDADGLTNQLEATTEGLDPTLADSDGDLINDASDDLDGDGLNNLDEQTAGTDLAVGDTDLDGLSDGAEVNTYGSDPTLADTDEDGLSDGEEVMHKNGGATSGGTENERYADAGGCDGDKLG